MIIEARVKPGSKKGPQIQASPDGFLIIFVREPANGGRANKAAVELLSDRYKVSKSRVRLVSGLTSRQKRFQID